MHGDKPSSQFLRHGNITEGSHIPAGVLVRKKWVVKNTGRTLWSAVYIRQVDGPAVGATSSRFLAPQAQPNREVEIAISIKAPATPGRNTSYWRLEQHGKAFGDRLLLDFITDPAPPASRICDEAAATEKRLPLLPGGPVQKQQQHQRQPRDRWETMVNVGKQLMGMHSAKLKAEPENHAAKQRTKKRRAKAIADEAVSVLRAHASKQDWACAQCTFENKCGVTRCHVCDEPKPRRTDSVAAVDARPETTTETKTKIDASASLAPCPALIGTSTATTSTAVIGVALPRDAQSPRTDFPQLTRLSLGWDWRCDSAPNGSAPNGSGKLSGPADQHSYWILASANSQYGIGAVSACTNMACTAAHAILNHLANQKAIGSRPFGCTVELIEAILTEAGTYSSAAHQSTIDVLRARPELCKSSWSMDGGGGRYSLLYTMHTTV
jgi:hypothetical protein